VRASILLACEKTKNNTGLVFNLALNYGGRAELVLAVKNIVKDVQNGHLNPKKSMKIDLKIIYFQRLSGS
jgi:undecaprenyl diphosphate synthase